MRFTDNALKALKQQDKRYDLHEGGGFMVRVYPTGVKTFFYRYTIRNKTRRYTIGTYPAMKLTEARNIYRDLYNRVKSGEDPSGNEGGLTVERLAEKYIDEYARKNKLSWKKDSNLFKKDLIPIVGTKPAADLTRADVIGLIKRVADRGAPRQSNVFLTVMRRMYRWANAHDLLEGNPCLGVERLGEENSKDRYLSTTEIQQFWKLEMRLSLDRVLKLVLVTAQRPGEVLGMHRREIEGNWWTIPRMRTKNKKGDFRVYLTATALELIGDREGFIFPQQKNPDSPMSIQFLANTTKTAVEVFANPFTAHDLRRTAATYMGELGFHDFLIGKVLNHSSAGVTGRVYNMYAYDKEKREILEAWERRLLGILK